MNSTTRSQITIGLFGIALVMSMLLISRAIDNNTRKTFCGQGEVWRDLPNGKFTCQAVTAPTPTVESLPDSWTTALAARLHNLIEQWHTCPKDSLLAVEQCRYEVTSQADAIVGDMGGHAPYTKWTWDLVPQEGTECWQRLKQLGSVAEYMARLAPQDYDFAQLHYNIAMRYSCVGVLP